MKKELSEHSTEETEAIFMQMSQVLDERELSVVRKTIGETLLQKTEEILNIPPEKAQQFGGDFGFFILKTFNDLLTTPQFTILLQEQRVMGGADFWLQHEIEGGITQLITHFKSEDRPSSQASRRLQA